MENKNKEILDKDTMKLPLISLRGLVIFPKMVLHFDVGRDKSIAALHEAMGKDRLVMLATQKDIKSEEATAENIYKTGVVAEIKQIVKTQGNVLRVVAEGVYRAKILSSADGEKMLTCEIKEYPLKKVRKSMELTCVALLRTVQELFEEYCELSPKMPKEIITNVIFDENYSQIAEYIAANIPVSIADKQRVLEESSPLERLGILAEILERENEILSLEREIYEKVKDQIDKNQREYYLREQLKVISSELNEGDTPMDEAFAYMEKIEKLNLSDENEEKLIKETQKLMKMGYNSPESSVIRNYLDNCLSLPWNKSTVDKIDISKAEALLNKEHYGMEKIKERILELLSVKVIAPEIKGQIICLVGPPGVGKTSIAKSIAKTMGRKYARLSLGGVRDESDIRGHRKTYIGAMPGRIITALKTAKSNNALILLDEIDKLGSDFKGDPSSALLEVLDSEQNNAFVDHYIEIPFDLSNILFIATANDASHIPAPLLDRMEIINLSSYTREEKFNIAKSHLVSKQIKKHGLKASQIKFEADGIYALTDYYTREAGVRTLEREIASICRKAAKDIVSKNIKKIIVTKETVEKYLGAHRYRPELIGSANEIGVVNGLAWTSVGGELLPIEISILEGSGKIELTGNLGDVMKESAKIAVSYVRSCYEKYGIEKDFYKTKDIHIHAPEGAVPKDGPSAGVTMTTALISALSHTPVKSDIAMTGEITLRGRVMPIGGLKEKAMAAYRAGVKTIIIPEDNNKDIEEIDKQVKENINFITANHVSTVLDNALIYKTEILPKNNANLDYTVETDLIKPVFIKQ